MDSTSQENVISNYYSAEPKPKHLLSQSGGTQSGKKSGKHGQSKSKGRKSLTTLQRAADSSGLTRPTARHKQKFSVYEEEEEVCTCVDVGVQVEPEDGQCFCRCHESDPTKESDPTEESAEEEANRLMVQDKVDEDYWQQLAEQRRQALDDTLDENQQLHEELDTLKEENRALSELAAQADYFASLLKELTRDESENQSSTDDQPASDDDQPASASPAQSSSDDTH